MKKIVQHLVILGSIGSAAVAAPFLTIGDNAELFTTADVSVSYNDNILLSPEASQVGDTIFTLIPGLDLKYGNDAAVKGDLFVNSTLTSYVDNKDLNNQLLGTGATASYDNEKLKLAANASYKESDQATVDTAFNSTLLEHHDTAAGLNAEISYSEKISFGAGFSYSQIDYTTSNGVSSTDYSVPVNVYYELTPKVDVSGGVTYTRTELDGVTGGNSDQYDAYYYNIGARGAFTPKLSGTFSVGYNMRSGNGTVNADEDGLGAKAALAYAYSEKTQITFDADRDFANATSGGNSYENTEFTLGASSSITVDWRLSAGLTYRTLAYSTYTNDYIQASIGAAYTINQYLTAGMTYITRSQSSDLGASNEFANNVVSLSLSARY